MYDLSPANQYLYAVGLGLHHSGIELLGAEYTFASGAGIFSHEPQQAPGAPGPPHRERLYIGDFSGTQAEVQRAVDDLRHSGSWGPDDYHLVARNCNHFAGALLWKLLRKKLPGHVNRLADLGLCCKCLLPRQEWFDQQQQQQKQSAGDTGGGGYTVRQPFGKELASSSSSATTTNAFGGKGNLLGGSSESSSNKKNDGSSSSFLGNWISSGNHYPKSAGGGGGPEDLTDRRERARKAALARIDRQQQQE